MRTNKTRFFLLILLTLALAACGGEETASDPDGAAVATQPAADTEPVQEPSGAQAVEETAEQPTADTPTLEPTPTEAEAATEAEGETADPQPTPTEAEAAPPAEAQFNGPYESTYYRGAENAPVTMIDYSDFL